MFVSYSLQDASDPKSSSSVSVYRHAVALRSQNIFLGVTRGKDQFIRQAKLGFRLSNIFVGYSGDHATITTLY